MVRRDPHPHTGVSGIHRRGSAFITAAARTSLRAKVGPMPRIIPEPRYFSMPSVVMGGTVFRNRARNCTPWGAIVGPFAACLGDYALLDYFVKSCSRWLRQAGSLICIVMALAVCTFGQGWAFAKECETEVRKVRFLECIYIIYCAPQIDAVVHSISHRINFGVAEWSSSFHWRTKFIACGLLQDQFAGGRSGAGIEKSKSVFMGKLSTRILWVDNSL